MGRPIKKKRKKCSTLSAVKKRKKKNFGERQSVEVVNLWNARGVWLACLWEWKQSGANVKHTRERERDARDEHWFVTEASRLCLPLFHRVPRDGLPRGSCRQGQYIHQGAQEDRLPFFYIFGTKKTHAPPVRTELLSVWDIRLPSPVLYMFINPSQFFISPPPLPLFRVSFPEGIAYKLTGHDLRGAVF